MSGSGSSTLAAPSWLPLVTAAYLFEKSPPAIGDEAHGIAALHLTDDSVGTVFPVLDTAHKIQGSASASLTGVPVDGPSNGESFFDSATPLPSQLATQAGTSITIGGWFRIQSTSAQQWLIHDEGPGAFAGGFYFYVDQSSGKLASKTASATCRVGSASSYFELVTDNVIGLDSAAGDGWLHMVCRYDAQNHQIAIFAAGTRIGQITDQTHDIAPGPGPFMLGCNEGAYCGLVGNIDEVFFAKTAFDDAHVRRIYACGIDGARCRCQTSSPEAYASCGFSAASCGSGSITPCNATQ